MSIFSKTVQSQYERHLAYFRVLSVHEPLMDVQNMLNERSYTIRAEHIDNTFQVDQLVFGSLVPWDGEWYWSGMQYSYDDVIDEGSRSQAGCSPVLLRGC
jgi:hypothetical protein